MQESKLSSLDEKEQQQMQMNLEEDLYVQEVKNRIMLSF